MQNVIISFRIPERYTASYFFHHFLLMLRNPFYKLIYGTVWNVFYSQNKNRNLHVKNWISLCSAHISGSFVFLSELFKFLFRECSVHKENQTAKWIHMFAFGNQLKYELTSLRSLKRVAFQTTRSWNSKINIHKFLYQLFDVSTLKKRFSLASY